jgi:hypothetical protein
MALNCSGPISTDEIMGPAGLGIGVQTKIWYNGSNGLWDLAVSGSIPKNKTLNDPPGPFILPNDWWCYPPAPATVCTFSGNSIVTIPPVALKFFPLTMSNVTYTSAHLSWDLTPNASLGITEYRVFKDNVQIATVSSTTNSYQDNSLTSGTSYNYYILAFKAGNTASSNVESITTKFDIGCGQEATAGHNGVTDTTVVLSNLGGVVTIEFGAFSAPDKLEIIHNGVKKATSGMSTINNSTGPYDNFYGTPSTDPLPPPYGNTIGKGSITSVPQFIGTGNSTHYGSIPPRTSEYLADTGVSVSLDPDYQQLIWWKYTTADFNTSPTCIVRVTGVTDPQKDYTKWQLKRIC